MGFAHLLSERTANMKANGIREILKVISKPGMISFAGGLPAPESFPLEEMYELNQVVLNKYGATALQYNFTEGFPPLQEALVSYLAQTNIHANPSDIHIYGGSQSVLDTIGKILLSPGDAVALESPSYLGAISAFNPYQPRYLSIPTDDDGIVPEALEAVLSQETVKFIYMVTTFQNPTGRTLSAERRAQVAQIIQRYNVLVVEDNPYGALRFRGEPVPPLYTYAPDHVLYVSTLSKVFAPGLRIGFCVAPADLRPWMVIAKQALDLHTSTYGQALAAEYLIGGYIDEQLPKIIRLYRPRQEAMLHALEQFFPKSFRWTKPEGGMFIWVEGAQGFDGEAFYYEAIENKIAFVPGKFFFIDEAQGVSTMRLNFTMFDEQVITSAMQTLGDMLTQRYD
ncbi:MAG: PLP-dependent aminotransferase family protein [Phototrophicaceae bacterium]